MNVSARDIKTIRAALVAAEKWEHSLAEVWSEGSREKYDATRKGKKYKNLRKKLGGGPTLEESLDAAPEVKLKSIWEME